MAATTTSARSPIRPPIVRVLRVSYRICFSSDRQFRLLVSYCCSAAEKDVRFTASVVQPQTLVLPRFTSYQAFHAFPSFHDFAGEGGKSVRDVKIGNRSGLEGEKHCFFGQFCAKRSGPAGS